MRAEVAMAMVKAGVEELNKLGFKVYAMDTDLLALSFRGQKIVGDRCLADCSAELEPGIHLLQICSVEDSGGW